MAVVGRALLVIALVTAVWGLAATVVGVRLGRQSLIQSGSGAMPVLAALLIAAFAVLEVAFLGDDFSFTVVATHSSTTTPVLYKAAAAWSSQEGSLLLWAMLLTVWSTIALRVVRGRLLEVTPIATAVLFALAAVFTGMTVLLANPFQTLAQVPLEGTGLNPLLRHASMMIHPPALYSGYTLFSIPFAFAIGALVTRRLGSDWLQVTRRFALGAWLALGLGILLGARWSYTELGWGGYWARDAVENAALLPWLLGTAYLHSATIQEKRGMLKVWNVSLVLGAGVLSILGTFLVRSGILSSIHAFVEPGAALRWTFVALIAVELAVSVVLVISRRKQLRSEHRLDSLLSREAFFLAQNVLLVALMLIVMWGTFFPLISEAITGTKTSVGPPWFDRYVGPLALVIVALMGIGPLVAWRRSSWSQLGRSLLWPLLFAAVVGALLIGFVPDVRDDMAALVLFVCAALVAGTVAQEFARGTRARMAMSNENFAVALGHLVQRNRRRYGGYTVHLGFALLLCGVAASSSFQRVSEIPLKQGQSIEDGGYRFTYAKPTVEVTSERVSLGAEVLVSKDGKRVGMIDTSKGYYPANMTATVGDAFSGEAETDVGLRAGPWRDLWIAIEPNTSRILPIAEQIDRRFKNLTPEARAVGIVGVARAYLRNPPPATFRILVSPLVTWIWAGGIVIAIGGLIAIWPARSPARKPAREAEIAPKSA